MIALQIVNCWKLKLSNSTISDAWHLFSCLFFQTHDNSNLIPLIYFKFVFNFTSTECIYCIFCIVQIDFVVCVFPLHTCNSCLFIYRLNLSSYLKKLFTLIIMRIKYTLSKENHFTETKSKFYSVDLHILTWNLVAENNFV